LFSHPAIEDFNPMNEEDCAKVDLDLYTIPAVVRKVLKTTKVKEIVEIKCSRKEKLIDHFESTVFQSKFF
jgi:hypothetical protein